MTYPDRISAVTENLDSYAKAFAELENDEKDLGTWAKAFSETSSEDDAKKLYIKLRVEQLEAGEPQAQPEVNETPSGTAQPNYTPPISNVEETPPSGSSTKLEFFLKNMPWTDKFAFLLIFGVLGHFIGGVTYDLGGSTPLDIYAIVSGQLWLGYVIFPFLVLRLTYAGYFSGLLPDSSGKAKIDSYLNQRTKPAEHQPELDVRPKSAGGMEQIVGAEESKIHAESTSGQPTEQKRGGEFGLIAALLAIIFVIVLFMSVESDPTPKTASKQVTAPKQLPIQEVTAPETIKAYDPTGDCRYRFSGPRYRGGVLKEERLETSEAYASYKVTHKPTGRYVFVDRAVYRAEAGEKAKTQFFEKYEDMCP